MPELLPEERLQPSLLDRLVDDDPSNPRDSQGGRVLTIQNLQRCVLRDLQWLVNSTQLSALVDLSRYPEVQSSVLNYGMHNLAGYTGTDLNPDELAQHVKELILRFEPRILKKHLDVEAIRDENKSSNTIQLRIHGELWAQPLPIELYLKSEFDLETGAGTVSESRD